MERDQVGSVRRGAPAAIIPLPIHGSGRRDDETTLVPDMRSWPRDGDRHRLVSGGQDVVAATLEHGSEKRLIPWYGMRPGYQLS